jgi:diaminopimelate epimerase
MRSSTWRALGNSYVLVEPRDARLTAVEARDLSRSTDGVVEVVSVDHDRLIVEIWNPDGSLAELSGNGTRIAAAWHAAASGARDVEIVVGERRTLARMRADGVVEQELGEVVVGRPETVAGIEVVPVSVGNPHAVVLGDPDAITDVGPLLETHERFPDRTNVQVARVDGPGEVTARVWERGVGETPSSGTSAVAVAAATHGAGDVVVHFPGGDLLVKLADGRATLVGTAERVS